MLSYFYTAGNVDLTQEETMFNYTWQMFMGGCRFWNHENETWDSDGCVVINWHERYYNI